MGFFKICNARERQEIMDKTIKNGHCVFFEGQTGECKAKEFQKCNPVRCKLYTLDSVSTILDLQKRNKELEDKFTKFFGINNQECWDIAFLKKENARLKQTLEEIEKLTKKYPFSACSCGLDILEVIKKIKDNK